MSNTQRAPRTARTTSATTLLDEVATTTTDRLLSTAQLKGATEAEQQKMPEALGKLLEFWLTDQSSSPRFSTETIDQMIAEIDRKLSVQMDEILHAPKFQAAESAWRGLKFLVDRTNFEQNIRLEFLDVSKGELEEDFECAPTLRDSKLCKTVFEENFAQYGGQPFGAILGNYDFGPTTSDMDLLRKVSSVAAQAHAPFIAAASPTFFGSETFEDLPQKPSVKIRGFEKWQSFRDSEYANYVGLTLPRFLLREPYETAPGKIKTFLYREDVSASHDRYLWGNATYAFGTRLTESFARYRWCPNIIGPRGGGQLEDLNLHKFESLGGEETKPATEVMLSNPRWHELTEEGFIPLVWERGKDSACFFTANSTQRPKFFGISDEGKRAETNFKLGTQLPYIFVVSRLAHHIQAFQIMELGSAKSRATMESELNKWVTQYVTDQDNAHPDTLARKPFKAVKLSVDEIAGEPGWYRVGMQLTPHLRYMGSHFTLSLVGKMEGKKG